MAFRYIEMFVSLDGQQIEKFGFLVQLRLLFRGETSHFHWSRGFELHLILRASRKHTATEQGTILMPNRVEAESTDSEDKRSLHVLHNGDRRCAQFATSSRSRLGRLHFQNSSGLPSPNTGCPEHRP